MSSISTAAIEALVVEVIIILVILRRQYSIYRGTAISGTRIALGAALILFLFAVIELTGYFALAATFPGLGWAILGNLAILVVAAIVFARYAAKQARIWKAPSGVWMYQMGLAPALLYVGLFVVRVALEFAFYPALLELGTSTVPSQTSLLQLVVLELVAALLAVSSGVLVGRSIGVYRRYQELTKADAGPPPRTSSAPGGPP